MTRILTNALLALGCLFLGALTVLVWHVDLAVSESRAELSRVAQQAARTMAQTSANANAVLIQVGLAADNARRASESYEAYNQKGLAVLEEASKLIESARVGPVASAERLLAGVSEDARAVSQEARTTLQGSQAAIGALTANLNEMRPILVELAAVPGHTTALLDSAKGAVEGLRPIEQNVERTTGSLAEIAHTGDVVTRPLRKKANQIASVLKWLAGKVSIGIK